MTIRLQRCGLTLLTFTLLLTTLLLPTLSMAAEPIGRLFLSPQERRALDELRDRGIANLDNGNTANVTQPINTTERITVNGVVQRSSGQTSVWLNQLPQASGKYTQGIVAVPSVKKPSTVSLRLPSGKNVTVKAGQTFDTTQGTVREGYENAAGSLPRPAAQ
jgi:hypothetical protein